MKACLSCSATFDGVGWTCPVCGFAPNENGVPAFTAVQGDSYHSELFAVLERVEPASFWFRSRNELIRWLLRRYFPHASSLLEVGCGTGFVLQGIRETEPTLELTGVELFAEGLEVARRRLPDVELLRADALALPFVDEFDVVCAFDVLEHIEDDEGALRQLAKGARSKGGLIVSVPQHPFLWSRADDAAAHQRRYTRRELLAKVRAAGFEPVRVTSFLTLPFPAMLLARLLHRVRGTYDFADEFKISPLVNRVLFDVSTLERSLIRRGASLPFGGSLFVVARAVA